MQTRTPPSSELPTDRLATSTVEGKRIYLYPADVRGKFNKLRIILQWVLVIFFLVMPWVKINGHPAILLDIPHRRFALFGITFWAHEVPIVVFLALGAALTLGFVTALWGRVWCGWACPQTVFVDGVFRRIERWLEGDWVARKRLDQSPLSFKKVSIKSLKWILFLGITLVLTHSFMAYFVGAESLAVMMKGSPSDNPVSFIFMLAMSGFILFDFGWFREQFCTVLCPYARFQSVLMDERSITVAYDFNRGEPRKNALHVDQKHGDCVNCYRCVRVCPTGIDIRRGTQLECIACTACIDACDEIMVKVGKPKGLIRYTTLEQLKTLKLPKFHIRPYIYAAILLGLMSALGLLLHNRKPVDVTLVRAIDFPYQEIKRESQPSEMVNRFKLKVHNQSFNDQSVQWHTTNPKLDSAIKFITPLGQPTVKAGDSITTEFFIQFSKDLLVNGQLPLAIDFVSGNELLDHEEVTLVGPGAPLAN